MTELLNNIEAHIEELRLDLDNYGKGNKTAGRRARKQTLALEKLFKEFRKKSVNPQGE